MALIQLTPPAVENSGGVKIHPIHEENNDGGFEYGYVMETDGEYRMFFTYASLRVISWQESMKFKIKGLESLNGSYTDFVGMHDGGQLYFNFNRNIVNGVFTLDMTMEGQANQNILIFCIGGLITSD